MSTSYPSADADEAAEYLLLGFGREVGAGDTNLRVTGREMLLKSMRPGMLTRRVGGGRQGTKD